LFKKKTHIWSSLRDVNTAYLRIWKANRKTRRLADKFEQAWRTFSRNQQSYVRTLEGTLRSQHDWESAYAHGLKLLNTGLKAIGASIEDPVNTYKLAVEQ